MAARDRGSGSNTSKEGSSPVNPSLETAEADLQRAERAKEDKECRESTTEATKSGRQGRRGP